MGVTPRTLVYLGTPEIAVPPLRALHAAGFDIPLVVSRADKRRGRGGAVSASPVKQAALELGIPVSTVVDDVLGAGADLGVVVAFGRLIPARVLEQLPMVNLHFSLLPRWRGAAPVERAILAGDEVTGVCLMELEETLDTGPVHRRAEVSIGPDATLDSLRSELVEVGTELLVEALGEGLGEPVPQEGEPTYATKIDPGELNIDWHRSAVEIDRLVRLGGAHTTVRDKRLKVLASRPVAGPELGPGQLDGVMVGTGDGTLELVSVQPEGKPPRDARAWANGARLGPDERLGE